MRQFLDELKDLKIAHRKMKRRRRLVRTFVLWHYALLGFTCWSLLLALFVVLNPNGPWRGATLVFISISFVIGLYLLFSGLEK